MELPKEPRKVKSISPGTLLIYSQPKSGKTTITAQLKNHLSLMAERNGGDFVEGNFLDITGPSMLVEAMTEIEKAGKPYEFITVDTLTKLDEWSEIVGTLQFMEMSQGKKFNRFSDGTKIPYNNPLFETVHTLPNGSGYQFSRNVMSEWYERLAGLAKHVIFLAHVKDKFVESKVGDTVEAIEINLTGKLSKIIASRVDAVGYFSRKGNLGIINFSNEGKVITGGRCKHLNGEIIISEKLESGEIKTNWEKIYLEYA